MGWNHCRVIRVGWNPSEKGPNGMEAAQNHSSGMEMSREQPTLDGTHRALHVPPHCTHPVLPVLPELYSQFDPKGGLGAPQRLQRPSQQQQQPQKRSTDIKPSRDTSGSAVPLLREAATRRNLVTLTRNEANVPTAAPTVTQSWGTRPKGSQELRHRTTESTAQSCASRNNSSWVGVPALELHGVGSLGWSSMGWGP